MDDKPKKQIGRRKRQISSDQSSTAGYESIPMSDRETTNKSFGEEKSPVSKGKPRKEDIRKWMRENIKLRPSQVSSKRHKGHHGFKDKTEELESSNARKSREETESIEDIQPVTVPSVEGYASSHEGSYDDRIVTMGKQEEYETESIEDIQPVPVPSVEGYASSHEGIYDDWSETMGKQEEHETESIEDIQPVPVPSVEGYASSHEGSYDDWSETMGKQEEHEIRKIATGDLPSYKFHFDSSFSKDGTSGNDKFASSIGFQLRQIGDEVILADYKQGTSDEEEVAGPSQSTDAFGDVKFVGYGRKIAKFVRVDYETPMDIMIDLITYQWNLPLPKLLISVIGGRKDFQLNSHLKEAFGRGLVKAAKSTGAWIISAGLHTGVVKYVGKAIYDNESSSLTGNNKVITISIAPWNCVKNKATLKNKEGSWPAEYHITEESYTGTYFLDPNHSHFILVDNGTPDGSGLEIEFRKELENSIVQEKIQETEVKIPSIVIMIEGGPGTLASAFDSVSRNIPVIIVKGSGRAADIIVYAYQRAFENVDGENENIRNRSLPKHLKDDIRKKIIKELGDNLLIDLLVKYVLVIVKQSHLITFFEIDSAEDFDVAILKALFKVNKDKLKKLWLALEWNRIDLAKSEIFTGKILWPAGKLDDFMLFALCHDRIDFVKFFMEHGVSLKEFLTEERIEKLYSMENKDIRTEDRDSLIYELTNHGYFAEERTDSLYFATKLFLWAVIFNRREIAFLFWKEGMGTLPSALVANKLLQSVKHRCNDYDKGIQLQEHADLFEERAIGVLTECYYANEKKTLDLLLLQRKTWNNASCMQIAFNFKNMKFVSQAACQSLLNKIWMGEMSKNNSTLMLLLCILCPLFIFLIKFDDEKDNHKNTNESNCSLQQKKCSTMFCKCVSFFQTPFIKFLTNLIFYIIFLGIYSYVLLVELKSHISILEWLLYVWVAGIFMEEIYQVFNTDMIVTKDSETLSSKFVNYISNVWNVIDVITITMFLIGNLLRFWKRNDAARVVLSLNLISFYIRFLHMLAFHRKLGPKLIMIKKMMQDLGYFIIILFVFMIAYGVASQSILYSNSPVSYDLFKAVFRKAYFHMYAELFLEEYEENLDCNVNNSTCPSEISRYISPVLMCFYILLTNILLLNLLIAMFSYTFQEVQEKNYLHWCFQRYELIFEFSIRPPLPPPFILLSHIYQFCRCLCITTGLCQLRKKSVFIKTYESEEEKEKEIDLILWEAQMVDSYIAKKNNSNSNNKNVIEQLQYFKYENSQNISFPESGKEMSKGENILNQKLQNIEEKINNIDMSLAWLKENLTEKRHQGISSKRNHPRMC